MYLLSIPVLDTPYSCTRLRGTEVVNLRRLFGGSFASGASFRSMRAARESGTAPRGTNVSNDQAITYKIATYSHPKTTTLPAARPFLYFIAPSTCEREEEVVFSSSFPPYCYQILSQNHVVIAANPQLSDH